MTLYVYRHRGKLEILDPNPVDLAARWAPVLNSCIPPGKDKKYLVYTAFHYTRIFRNRDYGWFAIGAENIKATMLCVPAHFRWPFMAARDIQFTYVMVNAGERGKGWGAKLLQAGMSALARPGRAFWYVTDEENIPSRKLAERTGFEFAGTALNRPGIMKRLAIVPKEDRAH